MKNYKNYTYNIVLGVNRDGEPIVWKWDYENSLAIVGKGGSGKTTASIYWMSQLACQGVRFIMCDPHADHKESLYAQSTFFHNALLMPIAKTYPEIMERIKYVNELGMRRIRNEEQDHFPVVLLADEFTSFLLNYTDAKSAIMSLLDSVNQFRKVNIRLVAISQTWAQAIRMASGLRDSISSAVVLKSSFNDASKFCAMSQTAKEASLLIVGQGFYLDERIWIPRVTSTDKLLVSQIVHDFTYAATAQITLYPNERRLDDLAT